MWIGVTYMKITKTLLAGGATIALSFGSLLVVAAPASALPRDCASYQASYNSAAYWSDFYYNAWVNDLNNGNYSLADGDLRNYAYDEQVRINYAQTIMEFDC
jgi:hypothetical protein